MLCMSSLAPGHLFRYAHIVTCRSLGHALVRGDPRSPVDGGRWFKSPDVGLSGEPSDPRCGDWGGGRPAGVGVDEEVLEVPAPRA